ncbi:MAG: NAD(P)H-hydrate dehydratase [Spirochaetia bacterium]|nr:NAD(P)H-hydrate dehydratase [Spirochaetia bacterium]
MKIVTPDTMSMVDKKAQEQYGIPGILLMEQAGTAVFNAVQAYCSQSANIVFLAGPGNNGGDAMTAARAAAIAGYCSISIVLIREKLNDIASMQVEICRKLGIPVMVWGEPAARKVLLSADIMVDGITGTGISGAVRGPAKEVVEFCSTGRADGLLKAFIIAVDIPSGMYATGGAETLVIPADLTVTMGLPKTPFYLPHNRQLCGQIEVVNPGFPPDLLLEAKEAAFLLPPDVVSLSPMLKSDFKNSRGTAAVFAGSAKTPGAAVLAASAALHIRAGLVTLYTEEEVYPAAVAANPSVITRKRSEDVISAAELSASYNAVLAGPGWGLNESNRRQLLQFLECSVPVVLDADALTLFSELLKTHPSGADAWSRGREVEVEVEVEVEGEGEVEGEVEGEKKGALILTPHPGEFERLSGISTKKTPEKIPEAVRVFAEMHHCTVVYKAHMLYIASPDGKLAVLEGLNPAMGTAGSGDVLAGCIAGLAAQGMDPYTAACTGAVIHQKAGKELYEKAGIFTADQLIPEIALLAR